VRADVWIPKLGMAAALLGISAAIRDGLRLNLLKVAGLAEAGGHVRQRQQSSRRISQSSVCLPHRAD
jgi:hypothetical protein